MRKAMQLKSSIKNLALKNKIPAQAVLQNFMLERLLERIALSKYKDILILKGGMLIASMIGIGLLVFLVREPRTVQTTF